MGSASILPCQRFPLAWLSFQACMMWSAIDEAGRLRSQCFFEILHNLPLLQHFLFLPNQVKEAREFLVGAVCVSLKQFCCYLVDSWCLPTLESLHHPLDFLLCWWLLVDVQLLLLHLLIRRWIWWCLPVKDPLEVLPSCLPFFLALEKFSILAC